MPDNQYELTCKDLFKKNDKHKVGVLVLDEFKEFMIECTKAVGAAEAELEGKTVEGSNDMWAIMFQ